jgi:hypothetical protein
VGRTGYTQYPPTAYGLSQQGLGQTNAFSQASVYLQTQPNPPPEAFSSLSQYRIQQVHQFTCLHLTHWLPKLFGLPPTFQKKYYLPPPLSFVCFNGNYIFRWILDTIFLDVFIFLLCFYCPLIHRPPPKCSFVHYAHFVNH